MNNQNADREDGSSGRAATVQHLSGQREPDLRATFAERDCRIEAAMGIDGELCYFRATHLPTGTVVEHDSSEAEHWGQTGRSILLAALELAVTRAPSDAAPPTGAAIAQPGDGWMPIETAPRDGTPVLIWRDGECHAAAWQEFGGEWGVSPPVAPGNVRTYAAIGPREWPTGHICWAGPTHWQPLPSPPTCVSSAAPEMISSEGASTPLPIPVSPAEGEVEEIARVIYETHWDVPGEWGDPRQINIDDREQAKKVARAILSSPYITRLREQRDAMARLLHDLDGHGNFANWLTACDRLLHEIGRLGAWSEIYEAADALQQSMPTTYFRESIAALSNADTSGLSSRRDEMVTPSAESASATLRVQERDENTLLASLADDIREVFGNRCEGFDADCSGCRMWALYDQARRIVGFEAPIASTSSSDKASAASEPVNINATSSADGGE